MLLVKLNQNVIQKEEWTWWYKQASPVQRRKRGVGFKTKKKKQKNHICSGFDILAMCVNQRCGSWQNESWMGEGEKRRLCICWQNVGLISLWDFTEWNLSLVNLLLSQNAGLQSRVLEAPMTHKATFSEKLWYFDTNGTDFVDYFIWFNI